MINDGHVIPEDECGLNFLIVEKSLKNMNQEIDPTGDRTFDSLYEITTLPPSHSGELFIIIL